MAGEGDRQVEEGDKQTAGRGKARERKGRGRRWVDPSVLAAVKSRDFPTLVDLILTGQSHRLEHIRAEDGEVGSPIYKMVCSGSCCMQVQEFLNNVPAFRYKINNIFSAVRAGSVHDLQLHLNR